MRTPIMVLLIALLALAAVPATQRTASDELHQMIFSRVDRGGRSYPHMLDVPLWANTKFLLRGQSHPKALKLLDDLLASDIATTLPDPRARALLQQELWQLFDWTTRNDRDDEPARVALRTRLAKAIRHVALTRQQIEALPASLIDPAGPDDAPNVFDPQSGWISVGIPGSTAIAEFHLRAAQGRSVFGVFLHHPQGPVAADAYLAQLGKASFPPTRATRGNEFYTGENIPQFPPGTKLALLRRMVLIDREGELVCSPITQSLQVRTFLKIEQPAAPEHQRMQEFVLDAARYRAGDRATMRALTATDAEPTVFQSHEIDLFEVDNLTPKPLTPTLSTCITCHRDAGAGSMNSYTRFFSTTRKENPELDDLSFDREITISREWKKEHATWGKLKGHWEAMGGGKG